MTLLNPYQHLQQRKRTWTPVQVTAGTLLAGGDDVIKRGLALRCLEIPVGDFIKDAMKGDLPDIPDCKTLLQTNVKDEINHDLALDYAAQAHGVSPRFEAEAERIKQTWLELDAHPILKAVVLERSVFFVLLPIFRFLGDTGLRTTSADISRDEQVHVAANTLVCQSLGLSPDKALNNLRRATVAWLTQSLSGKNENRYLSSNFWMASSDSLYTRGRAEGLSETKASRIPSFFEIDNRDLPQYS
jgi:hypothetical protein